MIFYIEKQAISKEWNDNLSKEDLLTVFDSLPARSREGMILARGTARSHGIPSWLARLVLRLPVMEGFPKVTEQ